MQKIAIVTNVIPSYRLEFYKRLKARGKISFTVFCQEELRGESLNLVHDQLGNNIRLVEFCSLPKERLCWQRLPIRELCTNYDLVLFYGNPRIISTLVWATLLRISLRDVGLWGQAHTAGAAYLSERIRLVWWRMFRNIFLYSDNEVEFLRKRGFTKHNLVGMNNGLNQNAIAEAAAKWNKHSLQDWQKLNQVEDHSVLLSCARLVSKNQYDHLISAIAAIKPAHPNLLWCVIGEGPELPNLQELAKQKGVDSNIRWLGSIYEEVKLSPWFLSAKFFVHPGAIGLSLLHAFGYALPVITHNNPQAHMPEFCATKDGENCLLFEENSVSSLTDTLLLALKLKPEERNRLGHKAIRCVEETYNTDVMVERFEQFASSLKAG